MSEDLALQPLTLFGVDNISCPAGGDVKSENATAPITVEEDVDDDLEDGEIDDDDDNDESMALIDSEIGGASPPSAFVGLPVLAVSKSPSQPLSLQGPNKVPTESVKNSKSKNHRIAEDDFAGSVESAIAAALKMEGIMPPMPKILESRDDKTERQSDKDTMLSKSSRRRKRRKLRDEREREKEKGKKKHRASSPDTAHLTSVGPLIVEELDDDEMLCIRGGSPQPAGPMPPLSLLESALSSKKEGYDSDDSYTSFDSYESGHNYLRYSSSRKKDGGNTGSSGSRAKRKERSSSRRDDEQHRSEKRSRRNYNDSGEDDKYQDRHQQQPRKLELCKFYLMECCAKKDKCSYMHSDFPCKYYYLGMECVYRSACKFSHGKPLTDQLRSVLLKHLETAPKEILGTFRRISRENALNFMNTTHERICAEHGVENTMAPQTLTTQSVVQSQAIGIRNGDIQQQQQQLNTEVIPSLLDMVINIPVTTNDTSSTSTTTTATATNAKSEKQRKSRWCDAAVSNPVLFKQSNLDPPSSNAPSYLDLKNLTGILSTDRIEKLSQFGVVNLEQINQLTLSQLNNIGLTINEISEIQLNARNMAKLGVDVGDLATLTTSNNSIPSSQDVDMRFLPSCLPLTTTTITTSTVTSEKCTNDLVSSLPDPQRPATGIIGSTDKINRDSNGTSSAGGIDYSQYLRDSNLGFDKNDLLDDEKDEEQLIIDDQDLDELEDNSVIVDPEIKEESENDDSKSSASFSGGADSNDKRLPPAIQFSNKLQDLYKDPGTFCKLNVSSGLKNNDTVTQFDSMQSTNCEDDDNYCGSGSTSSNNNHRRDTDTREEYRDPRHLDTKDEFRDPRLIPKSTEHGYPTLLYRVSHSDDESDLSRSESPSLSLAQQMENFVPLYERQSMYDWTPKCIQEDLEYSRRNAKADKDMRLSGFLDNTNSDIDLRLPFQPVKNIQIAKEIDASMSTLMPVSYKIKEIDIPEPKYNDLRQSFQCEDSTDPRLRRILGLPELSNSKLLAALGRAARPTIASPSSVESSSSPTREKVILPSAAVVRGPRVDPRRAASATGISLGAAQIPLVPAVIPQQNVEIRLLLQKSDWYKNLNSKYKIMVNQQLALVSTELKRFHQDPSQNKVFDIQFILSNQSLQQILTNLGIYIDDNGQVTHIESDSEMMMGGMGGPGMDFGSPNQMIMMGDPGINLQQRMRIQQQMEFLHGPPPNLNMNMGIPGPQQQGMFGGPGGGIIPQYGRNSRLSILGMPPGNGGGYNPFSAISDNSGGGGGGMMEPNHCGPNNLFGNNFTGNGGNYGSQQIHRGKRNNFNRQGGGPGGGGINNGANRSNQNRRGYKPNNTRDRRGGGAGGVGNSNTNMNNSGSNNSGGGGPNISSGATANQNTNADEEEETWDDID